MTQTEQLTTDSADSGYELAGRTRKSYRLAQTIKDIADEQKVDPLALFDNLDKMAWYAIVAEADKRHTVNTRTHFPSGDTQDAVRDIIVDTRDRGEWIRPKISSRFLKNAVEKSR